MAIFLYGRNWAQVQRFVETRSSTQSRSHAQKFIFKIKEKGQTLKEYLDNIDFNDMH
jgi:NAD-dependent SIR2 family protein deacetylase